MRIQSPWTHTEGFMRSFSRTSLTQIGSLLAGCSQRVVWSAERRSYTLFLTCSVCTFCESRWRACTVQDRVRGDKTQPGLCCSNLRCRHLQEIDLTLLWLPFRQKRDRSVVLEVAIY